MMGWQTGDQRQLFYLFNLERRIPASHLLRRINPIVMQALADLREKLAPFYSDIGRPSIDPELMIRMLIVGYCYGRRRPAAVPGAAEWPRCFCHGDGIDLGGCRATPAAGDESERIRQPMVDPPSAAVAQGTSRGRAGGHRDRCSAGLARRRRRCGDQVCAQPRNSARFSERLHCHPP
jgi:hypothetical protein